MAAIPRSADDYIIDNMVAALQAFSAEQVLEDSAVGYTVVRDMVRPPAKRNMPLVNVWLMSLDPARGGSSGKTMLQEIARIAVDCYARGLEPEDSEDDEGVAMSRLYYLKEQAKYALYRLVNADFGLTPGALARKAWPSWQLFQNDLKLPESAVVAGRWMVEVEYNWSAEDIVGAALDRIAVNAGRWSALYTY